MWENAGRLINYLGILVLRFLYLEFSLSSELKITLVCEERGKQ